MKPHAEITGTSLERYRGYLRLLARTSVDRRFQARLEPSDLVQQALLNAYQRRDQFRGSTEAELAGWLRQVLTNQVTDALRNLGRHKRDVSRERSLEAHVEDSFSRVDQWLAAGQSSPSVGAAKAEEKLRLADAVHELPPDQFQAITLHYMHGCTLAEVAKELDRSRAAVAGLLHRGLKSLRKILEARE
jgi:RNA polymerase sigma-70 factor (ECF subfamily)